jgi:hypothetical protein
MLCPDRKNVAGPCHPAAQRYRANLITHQLLEGRTVCVLTVLSIIEAYCKVWYANKWNTYLSARSDNMNATHPWRGGAAGVVGWAVRILSHMAHLIYPHL